jgi:hypothetical protein
MSRDYSKSASYGAEQHAFFHTLLGEQAGFGSLVTQTRELEATPEWQLIYGTRSIEITYNTGPCDYAQAFRRISYKVAGSWRFAVPHEMAHLVTADGHGPEWRARYVWLVRLAYGNEWAEALVAGFTSSKLSVEILPLARTTPVWPAELFDAQVGRPLFAPSTSSTSGPIAL